MKNPVAKNFNKTCRPATHKSNKDKVGRQCKHKKNLKQEVSSTQTGDEQNGRRK